MSAGKAHIVDQQQGCEEVHVPLLILSFVVARTELYPTERYTIIYRSTVDDRIGASLKVDNAKVKYASDPIFKDRVALISYDRLFAHRCDFNGYKLDGRALNDVLYEMSKLFQPVYETRQSSAMVNEIPVTRADFTTSKQHEMLKKLMERFSMLIPFAHPYTDKIEMSSYYRYNIYGALSQEFLSLYPSDATIKCDMPYAKDFDKHMIEAYNKKQSERKKRVNMIAIDDDTEDDLVTLTGAYDAMSVDGEEEEEEVEERMTKRQRVF